ncbi:MAG: hypothetical protein OSB02_01920 [Rhodospirillaceae bacterium]|nr:hypothetical protein [Rhodospirillaceae bacterium]
MKKNMNLRAASAIGALVLGTISATATTAEVDTERTIGLVVVSFYTSVYETKYMEECPRGLAIGNDEIWWKSLEPGIRDELTNGGDIEPVTGTRRAMSAKRGPNGEDVCAIPTIVQDPPHKTVQGSISYGMDLDGLSEGSATPKTCSHKNFTSPDGQAGIDNQMYRLLGCTFGWRDSGYVETNANGELIDTSQGVILIEVSDVDDKRNDGDVTVRMYRANDIFPKDAQGNVLPYASYRVHDIPGYGNAAKGQIVDGVLSTDPIEAFLPYYGNLAHSEIHLRDMRMELDLEASEDRAKGIIAGYRDVENFWSYFRKGGYLAVTGQFSCPSMYVAAHKLADGYPDPETGECTALSSSYTIETIPAFIVRPEQGDLKTSEVIAEPDTMQLATRGK